MRISKRINGVAVEVDASPAEEAQRAADIAAEAARRSPAAKSARVSAAVSDLFSGGDPETQLLARLLREIAIDMATQKGINAAAYRAELISRITS